MLKYEYFEKLLELRNKKVIEVAKDTRVSQQSLSQWKHNICEPKMENIVAIAKYFDVPIEYFITGQIENKKNIKAEDIIVAKEVSQGNKKDILKKIIKTKDEKKLKIIKEILS